MSELYLHSRKPEKKEETEAVMKSKKRYLQYILCLVCVIIAVLIPQTVFAKDGTDGTELQVMEPEKLEVQLGVDWAGTEFQLKTDAGLYPGTITVDQDGVLRLEIGGSKSYVLSCMNSSVSAPIPQSEQASATGNSEKTESETEKDESNTVAGIPVVHLILFGGGMLIAVGGLIGMYFVKKRQEAAESQQDYDDEDDE